VCVSHADRPCDFCPGTMRSARSAWQVIGQGESTARPD
jgi:hypothetical protein